MSYLFMSFMSSLQSIFFGLLGLTMVGGMIFLVVRILHQAGNNGKKLKEVSQSNILIECPACHSKISIGSDRCPKCGKTTVLSELKRKQKITEIVCAILLLFAIGAFIVGVILCAIFGSKLAIVAIIPAALFVITSLYYVINGSVQASKRKKYLEAVLPAEPDANTANVGSLSNAAAQQGAFCRNCGNQLNPGAAFCPKCGTKI